jgi:hypothetical protein
MVLFQFGLSQSRISIKDSDLATKLCQRDRSYQADVSCTEDRNLHERLILSETGFRAQQMVYLWSINSERMLSHSATDRSARTILRIGLFS